MGITKSKIIPLNDECPITLEAIKDYERIILKCKHQFKLYPMQFYCLDHVIKNSNINCPLCKKQIVKKDLKKIYKNWNLIKLKYDNWEQNNLLYFDEINLYLKKNKIINSDNYEIILPLLNFNNFYQSSMICTTTINNIESAKHSFLYSDLNKDTNTEFGEELYKINYCIAVYDHQDFIYQYFIEKILSKLPLKYRTKRLLREVHKLCKKTYFYFSNENDVITFDTYEGDMKEHFVLKKRRCQIMYNIYFVYKNSETYLINKVYAIIYF